MFQLINGIQHFHQFELLRSDTLQRCISKIIKFLLYDANKFMILILCFSELARLEMLRR